MPCTRGQLYDLVRFRVSCLRVIPFVGVTYGSKATEPGTTCGHPCAFPCTLSVSAGQPEKSSRSEQQGRGHLLPLQSVF